MAPPSWCCERWTWLVIEQNVDPYVSQARKCRILWPCNRLIWDSDHRNLKNLSPAVILLTDWWESGSFSLSSVCTSLDYSDRRQEKRPVTLYEAKILRLFFFFFLAQLLLLVKHLNMHCIFFFNFFNFIYFFLFGGRGGCRCCTHRLDLHSIGRCTGSTGAPILLIQDYVLVHLLRLRLIQSRIWRWITSICWTCLA